MRKIALLFLPMVVLAGCSLLPEKPKPTPVNNPETRAVEEAKRLYDDVKRRNVSMANGPCLSNEVIPDWSADLVHVPRQPVDDDIGNQCSAFRSGQTKHYVELDLEGNFVRAY